MPSTEIVLAHPRSVTLIQIKQAVEARGVTTAALAAAIGRPPSVVAAWLEGDVYPDLKSLEAMLRVLRLVPVFVPVEDYSHGSELRDYLDPRTAAFFDHIPDDPSDVLREVLRDLRLQRYRLEEDYYLGAIAEKEYRRWVLRITAETRLVCDSIARQTIAAGLGGAAGAKDVEWVYGDPAGPGYNEDKVKMIRKVGGKVNVNKKPKSVHKEVNKKGEGDAKRKK